MCWPTQRTQNDSAHHCRVRSLPVACRTDRRRLAFGAGVRRSIRPNSRHRRLQREPGQSRCPSRLLGRMNATVRFVIWGMLSIGGLIGGVLGSTIGIRNTVIMSALECRSPSCGLPPSNSGHGSCSIGMCGLHSFGRVPWPLYGGPPRRSRTAESVFSHANARNEYTAACPL